MLGRKGDSSSKQPDAWGEHAFHRPPRECTPCTPPVGCPVVPRTACRTPRGSFGRAAPEKARPRNRRPASSCSSKALEPGVVLHGGKVIRRCDAGQRARKNV